MKKRPPPNLPATAKKKRPQPLTQDTLERILMRQIFQPMEVVTKTEALIARSHPSGITSETREGQFINKRGVLERVQQKRNYVRTLKDGTSVGESGYVHCQTCKGVVNAESIHRCPCGKTCCISKGCGRYVKRHDQWYCSKSHALLAMVRVNLRWVS